MLDGTDEADHAEAETGVVIGGVARENGGECGVAVGKRAGLEMGGGKLAGRLVRCRGKARQDAAVRRAGSVVST